MKRTLCLLKNDIIDRKLIGAAIHAIESIPNISIKSLKLMKVDEKTAKVFYREHLNKPFFPLILNNIIKSKVVAIVLTGPDTIVADFRKILGATDPAKADLGTLRHRFGLSLDNNSFHGSDSDASAEREIGIIFKDLV